MGENCYEKWVAKVGIGARQRDRGRCGGDCGHYCHCYRRRKRAGGC